jgi:hypothetical protein
LTCSSDQLRQNDLHKWLGYFLLVGMNFTIEASLSSQQPGRLAAMDKSEEKAKKVS